MERIFSRSYCVIISCSQDWVWDWRVDDCALNWSSRGYRWRNRPDVTPHTYSLFACSGIEEGCRHQKAPAKDRSPASAMIIPGTFCIAGIECHLVSLVGGQFVEMLAHWRIYLIVSSEEPKVTRLASSAMLTAARQARAIQLDG